MSASLAERLWDKIDGPWVEGVGVDDCWLFHGAWRSTYGYGRIREAGRGSRHLLAHREVLRQFQGQLADSEAARHECDLPLCCNPFHLRPGTPAENMADKLRQQTRRRFKRRNRRHDLWRQPTPDDYFEPEAAVCAG